MPRVRLFLAIETPGHVKRILTTLQESLRRSGADVRWEVPEKFHITLKFLGDTDEAIIESLSHNIKRICDRNPRCMIEYSGLGVFPGKGTPRIVWAGVHDVNGSLESLARDIDTMLHQHGYEKEEREFHPHITLGRVKSHKNVDDLRRTMETITLESQPTEVREVLLRKSRLHSTGSTYSTISSFSLGM